MLQYDLKIFWHKWLFAWKINIPSVGFDKLWDKIKNLRCLRASSPGRSGGGVGACEQAFRPAAKAPPKRHHFIKSYRGFTFYRVC